MLATVTDVDGRTLATKGLNVFGTWMIINNILRYCYFPQNSKQSLVQQWYRTPS